MSRNAGRLAAAAWILGMTALSGVRVEAASPLSERAAAELAKALDTSHVLSQYHAPYDAVFRRDPMQALVDEQGQWVSGSGLSSGLSVQGIIWSDQQPLAIVDDALYAPGAVIGPYTIIEIHEQEVVVEHESARLLIPLDRGVQAAQDRPSSPKAASAPPEPSAVSATSHPESAESAH